MLHAGPVLDADVAGTILGVVVAVVVVHDTAVVHDGVDHSDDVDVAVQDGIGLD